MSCDCLMKSPIGTLRLEAEQGAIIAVHFADGEDCTKNRREEQDEQTAKNRNMENRENREVLETAVRQIEEYFEGKRTEFSVPVSPSGTEFQKKVWHALRQIPYGETRSYEEVAQMVENPRAHRAVGMANHKNPIPLLIPCHRVIGKNGKLTGYAGGLDKKTALLELERSGKQCI